MKRLIIVDISSFIFRAFYAIRPMTAPDGTPVNAVYGVLTMLMKLLSNFQCTHIILARDTRGGSFRNEKYPLYKANRGEPPEDLVPQFALIEELITTMQIPNKSLVRYEADDIIGSIVHQMKNDFDEVLIASGDKDLMQFVDDKVKMLDTMKDTIYGREEVKAKMGVYPEDIVDYLSLIGDTSDNIPGVKGIGPKGAQKLLEDFKNLDGIFANIEKINNKRLLTSLEESGQNAFISKDLVTIILDLDLGFKSNDLTYTLKANPDFLAFLDKLQFRTLKAKIQSLEPGQMVADDRKIQRDFLLINNESTWPQFLAEIKKVDQLAIEFLCEDADYLHFMPRLMAISTPLKNFICSFDNLKSVDTFLNFALNTKGVLFVSSDLRPLFASASRLGVPQNFSYFDVSQAHFVLNPDARHDLNSVASELNLGSVVGIKELQKETMEQESGVQWVYQSMLERSNVSLHAYPWLMKKIHEKDLEKPIYDIDLKLLPILTQMEKEGITLDADFYSQLEVKFTEESNQIVKEIEAISGESINLKSPKQVGVLLFEKLQLPVIKKTKTGVSTDSDVLQELEAMNISPIPALILKYRELEKLLSTYVKTLPTMLASDGRLHTHFILNNAATGRLSSEGPNLQNIPTRTENGRRLREGFMAQAGHVLIGADYSQVELRILAHFSSDPNMLKAFQNDEDIHIQTAASVFGIPLEKVTKEQRSYAKAINFGLMYGQSSFGLSQTLKISQKEAKEYITQYFERFGLVKGYLDSLREACEQAGHTITMFGRKRTIADINSTNRQMKAMAERMAINTPIQGTAADIIKLAMIDIDRELHTRKLKTKMLLQVHDELIFEVPLNEVEEIKTLVRDKMENVVKLQVPLKVDIGVGKNWFEI